MIPRRVAAWLGIVALLGNVLAAAFAAPSKAGNALTDDFFGPVVICTAHGPQTLEPEGDGSAPASDPHHCPLCTLLKTFTVAAALSYSVIEFELTPELAPAVQPRILADHLSLGGIRSRAPPLVA
jgi:hypothetical protein